MSAHGSVDASREHTLYGVGITGIVVETNIPPEWDDRL